MRLARDVRNLLLGLAFGASSLTALPSPVQSAPLVTDHIYQAAHVYGLNGDYLVRVAKCESRLNPSVVSKNGLYHGLFQFDWPTWRWMSAQSGYAGWSPLDPEAAAQTAAWGFTHGQASRWPHCRYA
jgi:soluble lytic murein transglycosylase-like protein